MRALWLFITTPLLLLMSYVLLYFETQNISETDIGPLNVALSILGIAVGWLLGKPLFFKIVRIVQNPSITKLRTHPQMRWARLDGTVTTCQAIVAVLSMEVVNAVLSPPVGFLFFIAISTRAFFLHPRDSREREPDA